jgi:hypothetical protein
VFQDIIRQYVFLKLNFDGIRGTTLSWIKAFLSDRSQQVIVDGATSVDSGVPHGTVLGTLLFLIFISQFVGQG